MGSLFFHGSGAARVGHGGITEAGFSADNYPGNYFLGQQNRAVTENVIRSPHAGLMLVQRLRRWPNIKPSLGERFVVSGILQRRYAVSSAAFLSSHFSRFLRSHDLCPLIHNQAEILDAANNNINIMRTNVSFSDQGKIW